VVIRFLEFTVPLEQSLKPHQVRKLPGPGCLTRRLFLKKDTHVIDLDDLLWVNLRNLQAPGDALKEPFLLQAGQRLPDGCPGDAEAFGK
jgi:hypothetical protein